MFRLKSIENVFLLNTPNRPNTRDIGTFAALLAGSRAPYGPKKKFNVSKMLSPVEIVRLVIW